MKNLFCECPHIGEQGAPDSWYDEETELPFTYHAPNECKCVNDIRTYNRNGKVLNLCSICNLPGDVQVMDS